MTEKVAIGVDIGGTKIAFAVVNRAGDILNMLRLPTPVSDGADAVFAQVATGIHKVIEPISQPIAGVGIGCPGHLNPETGVVHKATNMYWENVSLLEGVRRYLILDLPLYLQKDANAAALGEMLFGAAKGYQDFVLLTIGTGLGGGAVVAGEIVNGADNSGMEIGHMPLDPQGRMCICGMRGCPEMYISGVGLLAAAHEYLPNYPQSLLTNADITTEAILTAFRNDDTLALRLLEESTDWLASVMIVCMGILNPRLFVIGGGLGHATFDYLATRVREKIKNRTRRKIHRAVPIVESQVQHSAIGPACLVWHELKEK